MHDQAWSWVGEDGVEHRGSENQLTDALATGRLAPYTLVTKPEWRDWLPAMTVVELQWALPAGTADNPRRPLPRENLPKLPPPLGEYPLFRQRHHNLLQYAASLQPEQPSSSGRALPKYTTDDYDEPTVQIDAEELERALSETRGDSRRLKSAPGSPTDPLPPASPAPWPPSNQGTPGPFAPGAGPALESKPLNRAALAQRLALSMPTHPGYVPQAQPNQTAAPLTPGRAALTSQPPSPPAPRSPLGSSPRSAPLASQPGPLGFDPPSQLGVAPVPFPSQHNPIDNSTGLGSSETTMTSRLDSVLPPSGNEFRSKGRGVLWFVALVVVGVIAGAFIFQTQPPPASDSTQPTNVASVNLPIPSAPPPVPRVRSCSVSNQAKISDFAHAPVRPAVSSVPGGNRVAIAFAQSGKIAAGISMDPATLATTPHYSDNQNSPVWSVAPLTLGGELKFQTSRAASTLRSTTTLPTPQPLVVGLNRDHIAGRTASDVVDRLIWKSEWETITTPDWIQLDATTFVITFRGGGERGKVLVGKLNDQGKPLGALSPIASPSPRVEAPFITLHDKQLLLTFAGGDKPLRDKVLVATSKRDELPSQARELLTVDDGVTLPQLVTLGDGGLALQYTRGAAGKQQVWLQVYSTELSPVGEPFVVSPAGKDAYEGYAFRHEQQTFVLYFVRHTQGQELWVASLACEVS